MPDPAAPHRELAVGATGPDVLKLQQAFNRWRKGWGLPPLAEDGQLGHDTLIAIRGNRHTKGLAYYLGLEDHWLAEGNPIYPQVQIAVRAPWRRSPSQLARSARRFAARQRERLSHWRDAPKWGRQKCAQVILEAHRAGRVRFWADLSTGSDLIQVQRAARGEPMVAPYYGGRRRHPSIKMMRALAEAAAKGHAFTINALTGGKHSADSTHAEALSADIHRADSEVLDEIRRYSGRVLNEGSHFHCSFATGRL